jgi:RNA polymerase sigma factor (sigma-70 family)
MSIPISLFAGIEREREIDARPAAADGAADRSAPEDFSLLFERHYSGVLNYLYRLCGDRDTAEDLTSQTFLLALRSHVAGTRPDYCRPWLYRIATNVYTSHGRSLGAMARRIAGFAEGLRGRHVESPSKAVEEEDRTAEVRRHLAQLDEIHRVALVLRYDEEMEYARIAGILGISEDAARARVSRGLAALRQRIEAPR